MKDIEICINLTNEVFRIIRKPYTKTKRVILSGPGGTGKSTYFKGLIKSVLDKKYSVKVICPTHKSIRNLSGSETSNNSSYISTYCSFFKCMFDILIPNTSLLCNIPCCNNKEHSTIDEVINCLRNESAFVSKTLDLLIVEEVSMLDHQMFQLLMRYTNIKFILFVGDSNQIPAINNSCMECKECMFSIFDTKIPIIYLKEQKRLDNKISQNLQTFTKNISSIPDVSNTKIKNILKTLLTSIFAVKSLDEVLPLKSPIITYHVQRSHLINLILSNGRTTFSKGDYVSLDSGGIDELPTGSICRILDIREEFFTCFVLEKGFRFIAYTLETKNDSYIINTIHPEEKEEYIAYCIKYRNKKKKYELFEVNRLIKEHLTTLDFAYSITAHKAQGMTYEEAYIDFQDMLTSKDTTLSCKLLYSSISRAKNNVTLITLPNHFRKPDCEIISPVFLDIL